MKHPIIPAGTPVILDSEPDSHVVVVKHYPEFCHGTKFGAGGVNGYCYDIKLYRPGREPLTFPTEPLSIKVAP